MFDSKELKAKQNVKWKLFKDLVKTYPKRYSINIETMVNGYNFYLYEYDTGYVPRIVDTFTSYIPKTKYQVLNECPF